MNNGVFLIDNGLIELKLKDKMLSVHAKGLNYEEWDDWKRVGAEEVKDKYLERELQGQLEHIK